MKILIKKGTIRRPVLARIENDTNYYRHIHHENDDPDHTGFSSVILFEDSTTMADIASRCSLSARESLSKYVLVDVKLGFTL